MRMPRTPSKKCGVLTLGISHPQIWLGWWCRQLV